MAAPMLEEFLRTNIEGYLLEDIASLMRAHAMPPRYFGGCGYPLVMTVCSGIEVLGALLSPCEFTTSASAAKPYFLSYWTKYLYPRDPARQEAGEGIYSLARNGLAHLFVMKGPFIVSKREPAGHLTRTERDEVVIDCGQLAEDFGRSYREFRADVMASPAAPSRRVQEIWDAYSKQAYDETRSGNMRCFAGLPLGPALLTTTTAAPVPLIRAWWELERS